MKRKLLIASDSFLPRWDGVARFLSEIIPELTSSFSITVIAPRFKGPLLKIQGVRFVWIKTYGFSIGDYQPPRFDKKVIAEQIEKADLVWTHTIGPIGGSAIRLAKESNVKVVSYVHSLEWELVPKSLPKSRILRASSVLITKRRAKTLYNKVDVLIVPSREVKEALVRNKIHAKKEIVPMGVDVSKFYPAKNKREAKRAVKVPADYSVVGFCGRIAREKDLPTLQNAFLQLHGKYPKTLLLLVGAGLSRLKISHPNVRFIGRTNKVLRYLQSMDIYVLPSLTETSSLSTMEAMAVEVPVLVTPVGNIKFYVRQGYNGFFFQKGDVTALSELIERLLTDGKLRERLGRNARKTIVSGHRWQNTVKATKKVLSNL